LCGEVFNIQEVYSKIKNAIIVTGADNSFAFDTKRTPKRKNNCQIANGTIENAPPSILFDKIKVYAFCTAGNRCFNGVARQIIGDFLWEIMSGIFTNKSIGCNGG